MYLPYSEWIKKHLGEGRIQKLSVNGGFGCPNRDGTLAFGGCTYCSNESFTPPYCHKDKPIAQQLEEGKSFFRHKYPSQRYLAYFQDYSGSYFHGAGKNGDGGIHIEVERLKPLYEEALNVDGVIGLVIATRPDCVSGQWLDYLQSLQEQGHFIEVEYGVESTHDATLRRINRGHDYATACLAVSETKRRGITTCVHLILGLEGESHEMMLNMADDMNALKPDIVKLHQLQIVKGTRLAQRYEKGENVGTLFSLDAYIDMVVQFLSRLNNDICVERFVSQVPSEYLIAPRWGMKNFEFVDRVKKRLC